VIRNTPFAGGYITQRYGRPSQGIHALQIEIDRALYLDEQRLEKSGNFDLVQAALRPVIAALAGAAQSADALAAE
jgi:N-formylglutamate deformylase